MYLKIIFIGWIHYHTRTQQLGQALNAKIYYIKNFINSRGIIWKLFSILDYLSKSLKTIKIILSERPDVVFVQSPPTFAPMLVVFCSLVLKIKVVVDSHNGAFERPWKNVPLYKFALKRADIVLVHNRPLLHHISEEHSYKGVNFRILNDKLIKYNIENKKSNTPYFLIISTFSNDEALDILIASIIKFNDLSDLDLVFKITGNYNKKIHLFSKYNKEPNIEFLGFVPIEKYTELLLNAYGVISLTTRESVQQCALSEAVSAMIPFISNKSFTNRDLFNNKMILTEISNKEIVKSIQLFIKNKHTLDINIIEINKRLQEIWDRDFNIIKKELDILIDS